MQPLPFDYIASSQADFSLMELVKKNRAGDEANMMYNNSYRNPLAMCCMLLLLYRVIVVVSPGLDVQLTTHSCSSSFTQSFTDSGFQVESCTATVSHDHNIQLFVTMHSNGKPMAHLYSCL